MVASTRPGRARRLEEAAARLREKAELSLERDRPANTAKRARQAAAAEDQARRDLRFAGTVANLAAAIRSRSAVNLDGLSDLTQVDLLEKPLRTADWARAGAENSEARGMPVTVECVRR